MVLHISHSAHTAAKPEAPISHSDEKLLWWTQGSWTFSWVCSQAMLARLALTAIAYLYRMRIMQSYLSGAPGRQLGLLGNLGCDTPLLHQAGLQTLGKPGAPCESSTSAALHGPTAAWLPSAVGVPLHCTLEPNPCLTRAQYSSTLNVFKPHCLCYIHWVRGMLRLLESWDRQTATDIQVRILNVTAQDTANLKSDC